MAEILRIGMPVAGMAGTQGQGSGDEMRNVIIVIGATILLINGFVCIYHGLFDSKEIPLLIWIGAGLGFVVGARFLVAEIKD